MTELKTIKIWDLKATNITRKEITRGKFKGKFQYSFNFMLGWSILAKKFTAVASNSQELEDKIQIIIKRALNHASKTI